MDAWPQIVFEMADGEHTVDQFEEHLAADYENGPPPDLHKQIQSTVRDLVDEGLIRLHAMPSALAPEFAKPQEPEAGEP